MEVSVNGTPQPRSGRQIHVLAPKTGGMSVADLQVPGDLGLVDAGPM
jgi:hypothetical protein